MISCTDRSGSPDRVELTHQRMDGVDFVVPVGADQHQVPDIWLGQQILEQIQRSRVEPLQIVEEQRERMLGPREDTDKSPEYQLEAASAHPAAEDQGPAAAPR